MRILIQRVRHAGVYAEGKLVARIGKGLLALVGIAAADGRNDADYLAGKLVNLRVFSDSGGRMNHSALDVNAAILLVSQFTLCGDCGKGRRPSFDSAAAPAVARELYDYLVRKVAEHGLVTQTGIFQAHMEVELINDGPVTLLLESGVDRRKKRPE